MSKRNTQRSQTSVGTKFIGTYGTSTVIRYEHPYRIEEYVPHAHPDQWDTERSFAVDKYDATPDWNHNKRDMTRCGTCWLGYAHTEAYHNANVAKYELQSEATKAAEVAHSWYKAVNH